MTHSKACAPCRTHGHSNHTILSTSPLQNIPPLSNQQQFTHLAAGQVCFPLAARLAAGAAAGSRHLCCRRRSVGIAAPGAAAVAAPRAARRRHGAIDLRAGGVCAIVLSGCGFPASDHQEKPAARRTAAAGRRRRRRASGGPPAQTPANRRRLGRLPKPCAGVRGCCNRLQRAGAPQRCSAEGSWAPRLGTPLTLLANGLSLAQGLSAAIVAALPARGAQLPVLLSLGAAAGGVGGYNWAVQHCQTGLQRGRWAGS